MRSGVVIGTCNTLERWGLILLDNLTIGAPELKKNWIDVPAADGSINMSYALTDGEPTFNMRQITFSLYPEGRDEENAARIKAELMAMCHGKEMALYLPDDPSHYFYGLFEIGEKSGYNLLEIPVAVTADPYRYKQYLTKRTITVPAASETTIKLFNEQRRAIPSFTNTGNVSVAIRKDGKEYEAKKGTSVFAGLYLEPGVSELAVGGNPGSKVTIIYQEARL